MELAMPFGNLDILVLLREVGDPRPPARSITRGAGISARGLRRLPNPADLAALEEALCLKDLLGAKVTVLAIGPESLDDMLRLACSMGADRAIRCFDHGMEGGDAVADARVLARIMSILKPALFVTGNRLADRGDDPAPALAAASSGAPCIASALSLTLKTWEVEVLRKGDRGSRQTVTAPYPCTVLFEQGCTPRYPGVEAIVASLENPIERWELPELGLPFWVIGSSGARLPAARVGIQRPDPVRVVTPDPNLPAFERILSLLSGGIKAREGRVQALSADATAAALWDLFLKEGVVPGVSA
jgi:electron transfer flavoprotein beta subunit